MPTTRKHQPPLAATPGPDGSAHPRREGGTAAPRFRGARSAVFPLMLALSALTACGSDSTDPEELEIASMRLTVGNQTLTYGPGGTLAASILGASAAVSASFLATGGAPLTLSGDEFEIRFAPRSGGVVTFTRSAPFTGSFVRVAAGSVIVDVQVFNKLEGRSVFDVVLNLNLQ